MILVLGTDIRKGTPSPCVRVHDPSHRKDLYVGVLEFLLRKPAGFSFSPMSHRDHGEKQ